jgi:predicted nucleic acid-binding protein
VAAGVPGQRQAPSLGAVLAEKDHEADRWIAATAVRLGVPLVTHDRAFVGIDGLAVLTRLD